MTEVIIKLKTLEGKNFVDVDESIKLIKKELDGNRTLVIVSRGIEISRVALVIRRAEEECNCTIAKMETKNIKEKNEYGKDHKVLEFHAKLIRKG